MEQKIQPDVSKKLFNLYVLLGTFFIGNAILAEFIGVKIFNVKEAIGLMSDSLGNININMSIGVIIWPLVFLTSDLLNEYFGHSGVKRISYITAGFIIYASVIVVTATKLPPAQFWLNANSTDISGQAFDINMAYTTIFRQGVGIIFGSVTAFLVGQLVDVYSFQYLKKITGHKHLWVRATGSTVISQLIDSFLVLFIAFYVMGNWTFDQVIAVGIVQYIYKVGLAIVLTPLIYFAHYFIDIYLGKKVSEKIIGD